MSRANHPNINAAGLASAVIEAVIKHSRGDAEGSNALTPEVNAKIAAFCVDLSENLDRAFPNSPRE